MSLPDRPPFLRFAVSDTGIGISSDQLERIFLPFTQTASGTKDGAGLGLAISKRLVEHMGGRIWVESQPGVGSRFFFSLPSTEADTAALPATSESNEITAAVAPAAPPARVLLVEDNPANQELLRLFLEHEPVTLSIVATGSEALERFAAQPFDCVLMDVELPDMDGFAITRAMRQRERDSGARPTPVVILTAHDIADYASQARQAGCDAILAKPIRRAHLLTELTRVIRAAADTALSFRPGP